MIDLEVLKKILIEVRHEGNTYIYALCDFLLDYFRTNEKFTDKINYVCKYEYPSYYTINELILQELGINLKEFLEEEILKLKKQAN